MWVQGSDGTWGFSLEAKPYLCLVTGPQEWQPLGPSQPPHVPTV